MPTNLKDGTVSIGGALVGHCLVSYDSTKEITYRETLCASTTPYPDFDIVKTQVKGSVEFILKPDVAYITAATAGVALVITGATGIYFSGNVNLNNIKVAANVEPTSSATISFDFETVDGDYVWNKAAA